MKIAYVILHYMALKDTIECVESIIKSSSKSVHDTKIIVIDNGSPNDSFLSLKQKYDEYENVVLIRTEKNLGFARGNNLGFVYAKKEYNADFIVQLNNDTLIKQSDFNEKIVETYKKHKYAVLGPDIITLDGCHQNPGKNVNWSKKKLFLFRSKKRIQWFLTFFPWMDKYLTINESSYPKEKIEQEIFNTTLHGACFIYSQEYIKKFDGMYDETFLYMEEDILKLRADYYGYLMMYAPDLEIIHKEDVATNMVALKSIDKKRNIYRNLIDSSKVYSKLKKEYKV